MIKETLKRVVDELGDRVPGPVVKVPEDRKHADSGPDVYGPRRVVHWTASAAIRLFISPELRLAATAPEPALRFAGAWPFRAAKAFALAPPRMEDSSLIRRSAMARTTATCTAFPSALNAASLGSGS